MSANERHEHFDEAGATVTSTSYGAELHVYSLPGVRRTFTFELTREQADVLLADLGAARWERGLSRLRRWAAEGRGRVVYADRRPR